MPKMHYFSNKL